jgi:putative Mn2+ efflux pump MntP
MRKIYAVNDKIALRTTLVFGTMWTAYMFFLYGFLPVFFPKYMNTFMYWSGTVQLWSLPLIMVGQNLMGRNAEVRAQQDHETLLKEFELQNQEIAALNEIAAELRQVIAEKQ